MFYARNAQEVGTSFTNPYLLPLGVGAEKLTVRVREGSVLLQVTEERQQYFENDTETETVLDLGVHSLVFVTPITGWRFRLYEGAKAAVDFRAYG